VTRYHIGEDGLFSSGMLSENKEHPHRKQTFWRR